MIVARRFHIASFSKRSGISKYASDFYKLILQSRGYERLDVEMNEFLDSKLIGVDDVAHVEIGINQVAEIKLLYELLERGHRKIDVTLHDPPFVRWPYFRFDNRFANSVSKFVQLYLRNFSIGEADLRLVRRFFVLTRKGCESVRARYGLSNVHYLPFALDMGEVRDPGPVIQNILFFGFIAKNKGLDYALKLHEGILPAFPHCNFYVIGDAIDAQGSRYLDELKHRYIRNVEYLGFVEDEKLMSYFDNGSFAVLPFAAYKSIVPANASIIGAMKMGKVVFTRNVNAASEFIVDGKTGFFLSGDLETDKGKLRATLLNLRQAREISLSAVDYLRERHNSFVVGDAFDRVGID